MLSASTDWGGVQDSVETALNSSGDVFFTATAEEFDRKNSITANGGKNAAKWDDRNDILRTMDDVFELG